MTGESKKLAVFSFRLMLTAQYLLKFVRQLSKYKYVPRRINTCRDVFVRVNAYLYVATRICTWEHVFEPFEQIRAGVQTTNIRSKYEKATFNSYDVRHTFYVEL